MIDVDHVVAGFETRTLPKAEWTHEAHLAVCWHTVRVMGQEAALAHLRRGICTYNESTGTVNSPTSGYHETLTRYYIGIVAHLDLPSIDDVAVHPSCGRTAPMLHWSSERLFSVAARLDWADPDLAALPFVVPGLSRAAG